MQSFACKAFLGRSPPSARPLWERVCCPQPGQLCEVPGLGDTPWGHPLVTRCRRPRCSWHRVALGCRFPRWSPLQFKRKAALFASSNLPLAEDGAPVDPGSLSLTDLRVFPFEAASPIGPSAGAQPRRPKIRGWELRK